MKAPDATRRNALTYADVLGSPLARAIRQGSIGSAAEWRRGAEVRIKQALVEHVRANGVDNLPAEHISTALFASFAGSVGRSARNPVRVGSRMSAWLAELLNDIEQHHPRLLASPLAWAAGNHTLVSVPDLAAQFDVYPDPAVLSPTACRSILALYARDENIAYHFANAAVQRANLHSYVWMDGLAQRCDADPTAVLSALHQARLSPRLFQALPRANATGEDARRLLSRLAEVGLLWPVQVEDGRRSSVMAFSDLSDCIVSLSSIAGASARIEPAALATVVEQLGAVVGLDRARSAAALRDSFIASVKQCSEVATSWASESEALVGSDYKAGSGAFHDVFKLVSDAGQLTMQSLDDFRAVMSSRKIKSEVQASLEARLGAMAMQLRITAVGATEVADISAPRRVARMV